MSKSKQITSSNPERELTRIRLSFGCLGGVILALTAWGIDAYDIAQAHGFLPWAKFAVGTVILILLYGLASYLIGIIGMKYYVTFICYSICGIVVAWLAAHLSTDFYNGLISWGNPVLSSVIRFTYDENTQATFILTAIIFVVMTAIFAFFFETLVMQARSALSKMHVLSAFGVVVIFFGITGLLIDYFFNQTSRPPLVQTSRNIDRARLIQTGQLTLDDKYRSREKVFLDLNTNLDRPYKLISVSYDSLLQMTQVYLIFDDSWFDCSVVVDEPFYCEAIAPLTTTNPVGQ
jgi:hypothetical protein